MKGSTTRKVSSPLSILGPRCADHPQPYSDIRYRNVSGRWVGVLCNGRAWGMGGKQESSEEGGRQGDSVEKQRSSCPQRELSSH